MFVRAANPIWYFVDLAGLGLNDEYYAFFLTNTFPYQPQPPFRDPQGATVWTGGVIQFFTNGTLPDNLYFDPTLVYRIEIRHGNSQTDPLIYEINNFVPGSGTSNISQLSILGADNQVSNPTFSQISFISPRTITVAGTYEIAPDWNLVLTGSGTTTVTQLIFSQSSAPSPVVPLNYALRIANNGWSTAILYQRFSNNGAIFAGGAASMSIRARAEGANESISLNYMPSDSGQATPFLTALLDTGNFNFFSATMNLPTASKNTDTSDVAYVDMQIVLPSTGTVDITDVQFVGQTDPITGFGVQDDIPTVIPPTIQETEERHIDHLFNFYKPQLLAERIPSYLVGWDFPLNPAQFGATIGVQAVGANKSFYGWDQTIIFQSANSGVSLFRNPDTNEFVVEGAAATQFALIQYLDMIQARKILNSKIAVNISTATSIVAGLPGIVSLYYTKDVSLPNIASGTNNSLVATLDANGKPATFNGNWFEIPRLTDEAPAAAPNSTHGQDASFTVPNSPTTAFTDVSFNGWDMNNDADIALATYFAIVVGFSAIANLDTINFNSISINSGDIATRPAPQTLDEVLRECEYYYAKTFPNAVVPAQNAGQAGSLGYIAYATGAVTGGVLWTYPVPMRVNPTVTTYSPSAATANWYNFNVPGASGVPSLDNLSNKGVFIANSQVGGDSQGELLLIQATADARLGF